MTNKQQSIMSAIIILIFAFGIIVLIMNFFFPQYLSGYYDKREHGNYPNYENECVSNYMGGCD